MVRGLYAAASGMMARMSEQDVLANNLANASTPGFRRGSPIAASFPEALAVVGAAGRSPAVPSGSPRISGGARLEHSVPDLSPGPIQQTDNPLDIALDGPGFFTVASQQGYTYTRAGNFVLDQSRVLVTANGEPVLGWRGFIQLPEGQDIQIDGDGVIFVDGNVVDRLLISSPSNLPALSRGPGGFVSSDAPPTPTARASVRQGCVEGSNVNVVKEMTAMMLAYRIYEANQRALQAQDQTLDKVINDVGRV